MTHLKLQDMQQAVERNPNAWLIFSNCFGMSIEDFRGMILAGTISRDKFVQVLANSPMGYQKSWELHLTNEGRSAIPELPKSQ